MRLEIERSQAAVLHQLDTRRVDLAIKVALALATVLLSTLLLISQLA